VKGKGWRIIKNKQGIDDLIRRFLEMLERTFQKERRYHFKHGRKTKDDLKSVQEIAIAKIFIQNFADFLLLNHCLIGTFLDRFSVLP